MRNSTPIERECHFLLWMQCLHACTLEVLEAACAADVTCVAFNTHGWLKKSLSDMAPDSCDLYVKKDTPQPSPTPTPTPPPIYFWPVPVNITWGAGSAFVNPQFTVTVSPSIPEVSAYADRLLERVFQNTPGAAPPTGA